MFFFFIVVVAWLLYHPYVHKFESFNFKRETSMWLLLNFKYSKVKNDILFVTNQIVNNTGSKRRLQKLGTLIQS